MKLLPHGPTVRLAGRETGGFFGAKVVPALYSRPDWNCGRTLVDEEKRSGICLSMSSLVEHSWRRPIAVAKAQISDTQVNEVFIESADVEGVWKRNKEEGAFLQKCPKGRWRKISRQKTILVEDSPHSSFGDPQKTFYPRVQSYGKYVRRLGHVPPSKPILKFTMYREGVPLSAVEHRLNYELGIERDAIHWSSSPSINSLLGTVTQFGYAVGVSKELLPHASRHYNLNALVFDPTDYMSMAELTSAKNQTKEGCGYFYRILLRCVDIVDKETDALLSTFKILREKGFINYFGLNHFGIGGNALFDISRLHAKGQLDYAIGSYLQLLAEADSFHYDYFMAYVNATSNGTAAGIAKIWKDSCVAAKLPKEICDFIEKVYVYTFSLERKSSSSGNYSKKDTFQNLSDLWGNLPQCSSLFDRSSSEFIWNAMTSKRLQAHGLTVVPGDIVFLKQETKALLKNSTISSVSFLSSHDVYLIRSEEEARQFSIENVVLPIPYAGTVHAGMVFPETSLLSRSSFEEFSRKYNLDYLFAPTNSTTHLATHHESPKCTYRSIVAKPENVQLSILRDPSSLTAIKTDLFLLQERKPVESFDLSYDLRVREPCRYNISEKFLSRMNLIRSSFTGGKSVVLSFYLPQGCCPFIFLREAFDLRYGTFHDMFGLP